jgi:hypothetical protein
MDQDSDHDVKTLGLALYAARTGDKVAEARAAVLSVIGTETNPPTAGAWLTVSRNLGAYVIAADVLGLRADAGPDGALMEQWIRDWLTRVMPRNVGSGTRTWEPFESGSNASQQEGFAFAAIGAYLRDRAVLDEVWQKFQRFVGDPNGPLDPRDINLSAGIAAGWSHNPDAAIAINPKGTTKNGIRIDGAIINDMRRGGDFQHPPGYTDYPWTGTDGLVPAAFVLHRAGYPAFEVADRAILRAMDYLHWLRQDTGQVDWFSGRRGQSQIYITNWYYGTNLPIDGPVGVNRCVGFVDWTHPG